MRKDEASDGVLRFPPGVIDVAGPLVRRAEQFLGLHPGDEATLRRLFTLRLAHVPKEGEPVRRRATRADTTAADGSTTEWALAQELASADWRLLTTGSEGGEPTVEVAHETLLRKWPRLIGWIDGEREFLIWKGQLEADRLEYEAAPAEQRDEAALMGLALENAKRCESERHRELTEADAAFIGRSLELDEARRGKEAVRESALANERERSERSRRWMTWGALAAALIFAVLGTIAWTERGRTRTLNDALQASNTRLTFSLAQTEAASDAVSAANGELAAANTSLETKNQELAAQLFETKKEQARVRVATASSLLDEPAGCGAGGRDRGLSRGATGGLGRAQRRVGCLAFAKRSVRQVANDRSATRPRGAR
jgi:hypothetical protein